uniref:Cation/H+ exchanger domain-containing protein n=1 Tax=Panagrolaimus superbus TaxID=310955 RepID=A0A914Z9Z4_9BILA
MDISAILASVDPATTSPVVNESGAPLRFRILMEGESAVNDGLVFFTIIMVNNFHKNNGPELGLTLKDIGTLFESFLECFCLSPIIGIASAQISLQILLFSGMQPRAKQLLLLCIVYFVFFIGETVQGSAAVTIASFGITLSTQKEALEAEFWNEAEAFWELLSTLSTFMIFSFCGYKVGMQVLNLDATEDFEVARLFFFISAVFLSLVPIFCRMIAFCTIYNIVEPYSSVTLTEFSLLTWGGMRGGLAMLMALTLNNFSGDIDDPFYHKILLYTCGCVLPSILLQGTTFSKCVHLFGANLRSSYSQKAAKRLKSHLKSELAIKILELRKSFGEFLSGANWNCVNEYVSKTLFNLQYAKHEKGYVSAELDDNQTTVEEDDDISVVDTDKDENYKKDVYRTYYGMLLARVSNEWKRGALSGATALSLNNLIEHAIDEGRLSFEEIQRHVNKIRLSPPGKFFGKLICLMKKWLDYEFNRRLSQVSSEGYLDKDYVYDHQKKVHQRTFVPFVYP